MNRRESLTLFSFILPCLSIQPAHADVGLHSFSVFNGIPGLDIVSVYVWETGDSSKGDCRIGEAIPPAEEASFELPSGEYNILSFDELGNSYGIQNNLQTNEPDTLVIDLEHLMYDSPNVDLGSHLLTLWNSLQGFAIDTLILFPGSIVIDDFRIFPGSCIYLWLEKGRYTIRAVDQAGRVFISDTVEVPSEECDLSIVPAMIENPAEPIGVAGEGEVILIVENCLPNSIISELRIIPRSAPGGIFLEDLGLQPVSSIIVYLAPGTYSISGRDSRDAEFTVSLEVTDPIVYRVPVTFDNLEYDFGFSTENSRR